MDGIKAILERYCPYRGENVIVEVCYQPDGRTERCLHAKQCERCADTACPQLVPDR